MTEDQKHPCKGCGVCCIVPKITELGKGVGTPCQHLADDRSCGIYDQLPPIRPLACFGYQCWWRSQRRRNWQHRPDKLGALCQTRMLAFDGGTIWVILIWGLSKEVFARTEVKEFVHYVQMQHRDRLSAVILQHSDEGKLHRELHTDPQELPPPALKAIQKKYAITLPCEIHESIGTT